MSVGFAFIVEGMDVVGCEDSGGWVDVLLVDPRELVGSGVVFWGMD